MLNWVQDKIFGFLERRRWLSVLVVLAIIACGTLVLHLWQSQIYDYVNSPSQRKFFEVVGILLGPPVTAVGFYLGWRAKRDMALHSRTTENKLMQHTRAILDEVNRRSQEQSAKVEQHALVVGRHEEAVQQAERKLAVQAVLLDDKDHELRKKEKTIETQRGQLSKLSEGSTELWKVRDAEAYPYREWFLDPRTPRIITVANNKGGVGKSMVASMLAAYVSETVGKPVLLIDLDFQGSVSTIMLLGDKRDEVASRAERLLGEWSDAKAVVDETRIHLSNRLKRCWIIPANYTFAEAENKLLFRYVMNSDGPDDHRFRLAKLLLDPRMAADYGAIVIDTPPRLSLGTVNAIVASHGLVVPTILDKLSKEAVARFIGQVGELKATFKLDIRLLGIVGTMSTNNPPQGSAGQVWQELSESFPVVWGEKADFMLGVLPRRSFIANSVGDDIPYLSSGQGNTAKDHFESIGMRIFERLEKPGEQLEA